MVRDATHPDGLPEELLDPKHVKELRTSNLLLERTVRYSLHTFDRTLHFIHARQKRRTGAQPHD